MDLGLRGLKAIVTGGSKGIGRAIGLTLAQEGADVAICARDAEALDPAVAALQSLGVRAIGRALDVGDGAALKSWVRDVARDFGGIDIVVANVSALAIDDTEENWAQSFQVDLMHSVRLVEAALPFLLESRAAAVVTISSVSGREVDLAAGPYGVFKAAIIHFTKGLSFQLASKGIRANVVSPGDTYFEGGFWEGVKRDDPKLYAESLALNPTGRMARPEEIANAVAFLASPAASYVNGTNLVVDGALTRGVQF
jgi:3-oxoacyl-[acyl-carrier protein] reductase